MVGRHGRVLTRVILDLENDFVCCSGVYFIFISVGMTKNQGIVRVVFLLPLVEFFFHTHFLIRN